MIKKYRSVLLKSEQKAKNGILLKGSPSHSFHNNYQMYKMTPSILTYLIYNPF